MRRIDRRRLERLRRRVISIGLSFSAGALAATLLIYRAEGRAPEPEPTAVATTGTSAPASAPRASATEASARTPAAAPPSMDEALGILARRHLEIPVEGVKPSDLRDTYDEARAAGRRHDAIDIMSPRGTEVRAVDDGTIAKLFTSKDGGLTIYQFDPTRTFSYYYAHLDHYAAGLAEHQDVKRGQLLGYVGSTGNASENAPHLHFAIARLETNRAWWKGDPINPYPLLAR